MSQSPFLHRMISVAGIALLVPAAAGCVQGKEPPLATIAGPEAHDLLPRVTGHLVMTQTGGGMVAVSLPDLEQKSLFTRTDTSGAVHFVSGPDRDGRIVYVENHMVEGFVRLMTKRIDGTGDRQLFQRSGDALWLHAMSAPALAPTGGLVALVWNAKPDYKPDVVGRLEIWDIARPTGTETAMGAGIIATDRGLSWFPDGARLAFVQMLPEVEAHQIARPGEEFDSGFAGEGQLPVITLLDVTTDARTRLHIGVQPLVSPDGSFLLLQDAAAAWWRMDLPGGEMSPVTWPGNWRGPIALVTDDLLLYWALPTEGEPVEYTQFGSPLVKRHAMGDIKLGVPGTRRFTTVVRAVDPRQKVSFGSASR